MLAQLSTAFQDSPPAAIQISPPGYLLKWQYQPGRQGSSWSRRVKEQRKAVAAAMRQTPILKASLSDADWLAGAWSDAVTKAVDETGLDNFPEDCPWSMEQVLSAEFLPEA